MVVQYILKDKMPKIDIRGYWDYTQWWVNIHVLGGERVFSEPKEGDIISFKGNSYRVIHVKEDKGRARWYKEDFFYVFVLKY